MPRQGLMADTGAERSIVHPEKAKCRADHGRSIVVRGHGISAMSGLEASGWSSWVATSRRHGRLVGVIARSTPTSARAATNAQFRRHTEGWARVHRRSLHVYGALSSWCACGPLHGELHPTTGMTVVTLPWRMIMLTLVLSSAHPKHGNTTW